MEKVTKKLYKIALITSPLISLFAISPLFIFEVQAPGDLPLVIVPYRHLIAFAITTILVLIIWLINIRIHVFFENKTTEESNQPFYRYLISFFTIFIFTTILLITTKVFFKEQNLSHLYPYIGSFSNNSIVLIILNLVTLQHHKSKIEIENADLKFNKLFAEQEHLKNQLQPHFLFNALTTLKSLIKKQPDKAEEYVKRLSDFLRTSITMSDKNTISLERELELCLDYLEMQKMRFKSALNYTINVPIEDLKHLEVPVFAIQLLIENAIKHNAFTMDDPIYIVINHHQNSITVENNIIEKRIQSPSTHLGLKNLSDRYITLTGKGVEIRKTETSFTVEIYLIKANENNNNRR